MRRRDVLDAMTALGAGAIVVPADARAQPGRAPPLIGYLFERPLAPDDDFHRFRDRLAQLGFRDGQEVILDYRSFASAERGRLEAADLVRRGARVLVAQAPQALEAARAATGAVPIVAFHFVDPQALGLAESLARPTRNVTGFTWDAGPDQVGKYVEILRELVPAGRALAVLFNPANPVQLPRVDALAAVARRFGLSFVGIPATAAEIASGFETVGRLPARHPLVVMADPLTIVHRDLLSARMLRAGAIALVSTVERRFDGCVVAFGARTREQPARAAEYVVRILDGATPAELPIVQPNRFELLVNLRTARAVGVDVPAILLARADEVIE